MYELTDRVIKLITRKNISIFSRIKSRLLGIDEVSAIRLADTSYDDSIEYSKEMFKKIYDYYYHKTCGKHWWLTDDELEDILMEYDYVTKYRFLEETDRKKARFIEMIIADSRYIDRLSNGKSIRNKDIVKARNLLDLQERQMCIEITDIAVIRAYKEMGIKKVMWVTTFDNKTCEECKDRNGVIYDIDKVPPKPHRNCRCYLKAVN